MPKKKILSKYKVRCKWEFKTYRCSRGCHFKPTSICYGKCNEEFEVDWTTFIIDRSGLVKSGELI